MTTSIFYSSLSKDFSLILNDVNDSNVIIQVGENQEFYAHSIILRARSPYFRKAFSTELIIKENNMFIFNKSNIPPSVFKLILKFIYTGELDLTIQLSEDVLGLLVASDELLLGELFEYVQDYLIEQQPTWIQQNFVYVLHNIFNLTSCNKLRDYCLEFICEDPQPLISSKDFPSLDKEILYDLFGRNDLQIDEVVAWDSLIKWGIGQTGLECKKSIGWNNEDYETLEKTLCQLIPLIRFVDFSPSEFFNKVSPYKLIIPKEIYEGFKQFHCKGSLPTAIALPPRTRKIKSKIIKPQLTNIIVNWINNKVYRTKCNSRYKFNLIYRGSRDGINNHSFKEKCKGQVASLVLIKTHESDEIIGGYSSIGFNPIGNKNFDGMLFYYSSDNFIFSFEHSEDTENMKISRVKNHFKAMLVHEDNAFNFGQGSLCMDDQNLYVYNDGEYYENNLNTKSVYTIEEIETFIVVKQ